MSLGGGSRLSELLVSRTVMWLVTFYFEYLTEAFRVSNNTSGDPPTENTTDVSRLQA